MVVDIIGFMENTLRDPYERRFWSFPLPFSEGRSEDEIGRNIASAALQNEWMYDPEIEKLDQHTHPEVVHSLLHNRIGLYSIAERNPHVLSIYTPQLTIRGFDAGLEAAFDSLLDPNNQDSYTTPGYGGPPETVDGGEPECGELIAWRHPTFGNYTDGELAYTFIGAHDGLHSRRRYGGFLELVWLLSDEADWLPTGLRERLLAGLWDRSFLWFQDAWRRDSFFELLALRPRSRFRWTRSTRDSLLRAVTDAATSMDVKSDPAKIRDRFIERDFVRGHYDLEQKRRSR
jgi:hypothetical protein